MNRRVLVRWISFGTAAVVCVAAALIACFSAGDRYENRINADTARSFCAAVDAVDMLERSLRKSACAMTPVMESMICTEICSSARQVETAFSALPVRSSSLERMARHVSVVGDYAAMLARANASGSVFDASVYEQLAKFSDTTARLHDALFELQQEIADGDAVSEHFERITDALHNLESEAAHNVVTMEDAMEQIAETFPEVHAISYDGKYSDHASEGPKALAGSKDCTSEECTDAAAKWLGCETKSLENKGVSTSDVPCWLFSCKINGRINTIAVTKSGAQVLWLLCEAPTDDAVLSLQDAQRSAAEYLNGHGYSDMEAVSVSVSGGAAIITFAPVLDHNVLCETDLVKVGVSLSDGSVVGFDASDYMQYHTERDLRFSEFDGSLAYNAIPEFLTLSSIRPVICPSVGDGESACYLCKCVDQDGAEYHIYVNAATGEQEAILLPDEIMTMDSF